MGQRHIAVIDLGAGNLHSVAKALQQVTAQQDAVTLTVTNDPQQVARATHIVLPGVGAFADCMKGLNAIAGMRQALETQVLHHKKPFLGICVGMQMLFEYGHEHGTYSGLGWLKGEVVKVASAPPVSAGGMALKVPHMGWNTLHLHQPDHALFSGIKTGDYAYFVHSYHCQVSASEIIAATTEHGAPLAAAICHENVMATQFHPEKSQRIGLQILRNFVQSSYAYKN